MPGKEITDPCFDCKEKEAVVTCRKRRLCRDCFLLFINIKVTRRMGNYRMQNAPKEGRKKVLLPVSFGVSSTVLLHVIDNQLQRQMVGQGRTSYDLHVLTVNPSPDSTYAGRIVALEKLYPDHTYTEIPLSSIFHYDQEILSVMAQFASTNFEDDPTKPDIERLDSFRSSLSSATSTVDVDEILLTRLIVSFAKGQGCEGILWGDSDSRLAAKTLAGVAKGRGASLTWQICDGMSQWDINFNFPMREVFKSEIEAYSTLLDPGFSDIIIPQQALPENSSNRNMSIDDLMTHYIQTQGEKYPGVMANIVRTVNKLDAPSVLPEQSLCKLCSAPIIAEPMPGEPAIETTAPGFCYGCVRSRP